LHCTGVRGGAVEGGQMADFAQDPLQERSLGPIEGSRGGYMRARRGRRTGSHLARTRAAVSPVGHSRRARGSLPRGRRRRVPYASMEAILSVLQVVIAVVL